ncbi:hypothetical protein LINPERHAP2_LOCUS25751 [Linum perenne]
MFTYLEKRTHCAKLNRVFLPLYDGLTFLFGKGRATGKGVVGVEDLNQACPLIEDHQRMMLDWNNQSECGDEENNHNDQTTHPPMDEEHTPTFSHEKTTQSEASSQPKRMCRSKTTSGSEVSDLKPILEDAASSLKSMLVEF